MGKEISRRGFLELAGLGTAGLLASSCSFGRRTTSTERTPTPSTERLLIPTETRELTRATPVETKEVEQGILWTQKLLFPPEIPGGSFLADEDNPDKIFLVTPEGYPATFNLATGEKLWQWEDRGTIYGTEPGTVYAVRYDKRILALEAQTGQEKWNVVPNLPSGIEQSFPMIIGKETIHFPYVDNRPCSGICPGYAPSLLLSIDKKTGQVLWWENSREARYYQGSESTIIIIKPFPLAARARDFKGVNPVTGEQKWTFGDVWSGVFTGDRLFCTEREELGAPLVAVGIDLDSGKEVWRASKGTEDWRSYEGVIVVSPTRIYALYSADPTWPDAWYLGAFDRQTGEELWKGPDIAHISWAGMIPEQIMGWNFIGEIEGVAIVSSENLGYTDAINFERNVVWRNDDLRINRVAGIAKNTLIAEYNNPDSPPSFLFGLDPETGERKWRLELSQVTHEAIIFHDKVNYGNGQVLTVLDPETGALLSTIPLPDQPTRLVPQKDFLLAQSGGNLSAIVI